MMISTNASRALVDIAFQGGTFLEQAARAHDFAAKVFRAFAELRADGARGRRVSVPSVQVTENESYMIVRLECDDAGFAIACEVANRLNTKEL